MSVPPSPLFKRIVLLVGDAFALALAVAASLVIRHRGLPDLPLIELYAFATPFLLGLWTFGFLVFDLYELSAAKNGTRFAERFLRAVAFNAVLSFIILHLVPEFRITPKATMLILLLASTILIGGWRILFNAVIARTSKDRLLFLGVSREALELARHLRENLQLGYVPIACLPVRQAGRPGRQADLRMDADHAIHDPSGALPIQDATLNELPVIMRERGISLVVVARDLKGNAALMRVLFESLPIGIGIIEFPRFYEMILGKVPTSLVGETWFLENLTGRRRRRYEFLKRATDVTAAILIGAFALALLPFIAIAIVLSTPGEIRRYRTLRAHTGDGIVFFRQKRIGRNGMPFGFIKFRSQRLGSEKIGWEKGEGPDPRAYPFGNLIRRAYLDELPQVWNVIKGEMSFVGPRPERPEFVASLERSIPFYRIRELVPPGITGWAQLNMTNDASVSDAPEKLQYDLYYLKHRSIFLDFVILAKTALRLLQRNGR